MPVTLTGTASATSRAAPTLSAPAGSDPPSAASNNAPDQALLNLVASVLAHGVFQDIANTFAFDPTFPARTVLQPGGGGGNPAVGSGWGLPGGQPNLRVYLTPTGRVQFEGILQLSSSSPAALIFTLPAGYYKAVGGWLKTFVVPVVNTGTSVYDSAYLEIDSDGTVNLDHRISGSNAASNNFLFNFSYDLI